MPSKQRLLFVCGATATGKTSVGIELAKQFDGEIVSADSRQIYTGMDIGTGKDIPTDSRPLDVSLSDGSIVTCYDFDEIRVWGLDIVQPDETFSVAEFRSYAIAAIKDIWSRNKLAIIVGGTGLYASALLYPPDSMGVSQNSELRACLDGLSVNDLQHMLRRLDPPRIEAMNHSDQSNPRRLVRAIEVASNPPESLQPTTDLAPDSSLWIGLTAPIDYLEKRIAHRIAERIGKGMSQEVSQLVNRYPRWDGPAFSATGYKEWRQFLEGDLSQEDAVAAWLVRERQYAKRQLTWFNKQPDIHWFDILKTDNLRTIVAQVRSWYSEANVSS